GERVTGGQGPAAGGAGSGRPDPGEEPGGWTGPRLHDVDEQWGVVGGPSYLRGVLVTLRTDQVQRPGGELAKRDVVEHPGAVAIVALDRDDRVLLIRHYRHPAGHLLWELPAGLRDVAGEDPRVTAERELLEEAGYRASDWQELADFFTSPGILTERVRVFLARGVTFVPESERGGHAPEHEEAHLLVRWVPLHQAVRLFLAGDLHNGVTAVGILSAYAVQQGGFAALREEDVLPER
ncbi:MAG TPA: NUDIX hydrolase, partial [Streptosporangiaceae bacterium]